MNAHVTPLLSPKMPARHHTLLFTTPSPPPTGHTQPREMPLALSALDEHIYRMAMPDIICFIFLRFHLARAAEAVEQHLQRAGRPMASHTISSMRWRLMPLDYADLYRCELRFREAMKRITRDSALFLASRWAFRVSSASMASPLCHAPRWSFDDIQRFSHY